MTRKQVMAWMFVGLATLALAGVANADTMTFTTTSTASTSGGHVAATMTVTTTSSGLDITVTNDVANLFNQAQVITGLELKLKTSKTFSLQSSSGMLIDIHSDGSGIYDTLGTQSTNFQLSNTFFSGGLALCAGGCGTWHPEGIVGAPGAGNKYSNANSSVGNDPHSPQIQSFQGGPVVTFHLYASGISSSDSVASLVSGANFVFGTGGETVSACSSCGGPPPPPPGVPEPGSLVLFGTGVASLIRVARRKLS